MPLHPELTEHAAKNTRAGVVATGLASVAVILGLYERVPGNTLLVWCLVQLCCMALRWHAGRALLAWSGADPKPGARWAAAVRWYTLVMGLSGLGWGMAAVLVAWYADLLAQLFVLAILLGIIGGAVATVSPVFPAYLAYLAGIMGPQTLVFVLGDNHIRELMGLLSLLYCTVVFVAGRTLSRSMFRSVELRTSLEAAKQAAEAANVAKSKFLSGMSHELRTPLNAVLGFGQLLQMDDTLPAQQRANADEIMLAGGHLLTLINEILDLARIESGQMTINLEPVVLAELLHECETLARTLGEKYQIRVEFEAVAVELMLTTDRLRLKQVLLNLLSNGIKYNRPGGSVRLNCQTLQGKRLRITVQDTGLGIPEALQGQLFQAFNRLGREAGEKEGSGIGLLITRELVHLIGGEIGFESRAGKGSTFWVDLPLLPRAQGEATPAQVPST